MRFKSLLVHRCSILTAGETTGEDDYGRPIQSMVETINVPCRVDQVRERVVSGATGDDFILNNTLILSYPVYLDSKVLQIKDLDGNLVLEGSFSIEHINPFYKGQKLHHYEISLQRE
ncbi:putative minor capsid protein [Priestia megaterium]